MGWGRGVQAGGEAEDYAYYDPHIHDDSGARPKEARAGRNPPKSREVAIGSRAIGRGRVRRVAGGGARSR